MMNETIKDIATSLTLYFIYGKLDFYNSFNDNIIKYLEEKPEQEFPEEVSDLLRDGDKSFIDIAYTLWKKRPIKKDFERDHRFIYNLINNCYNLKKL